MPLTPLILTNDGSFYGITPFGPNTCFTDWCGTIYKITPDRKFSMVHAFCAEHDCPDGETPWALLQAADGNLYGTAAGGGKYNSGTLFRLSVNGAFNNLYSFCAPGNCSDGGVPNPLIEGSDRNLYGTSSGIVRITRKGIRVVHTFDEPDGQYNLLQGVDGSLYGVAFLGGANNAGTFFKLSPSGEFTSLYSFCASPGCADGAYPTAVVQGNDGNFYGTTLGGGDTAACTQGCGTVFRITAAGSLTVLHEFEVTDRVNPRGLYQGTDGILYGPAGTGFDVRCKYYLGAACGEIFSLNAGLSPFVTFVSDSGKVGQTGGILGQGLTGTTSVTLNGIPASFRVISDTYLVATVPPGATTGYVTVTTPSATLTSNKPFVVLP